MSCRLKAGQSAARTLALRLQPSCPAPRSPFPRYWEKGPGVRATNGLRTQTPESYTFAAISRRRRMARARRRFASGSVETSTSATLRP